MFFFKFCFFFIRILLAQLFPFNWLVFLKTTFKIQTIIILIYLVALYKIKLYFNEVRSTPIIRTCNFAACEISHTNWCLQSLELRTRVWLSRLIWSHWSRLIFEIHFSLLTDLQITFYDRPHNWTYKTGCLNNSSYNELYSKNKGKRSRQKLLLNIFSKISF